MEKRPYNFNSEEEQYLEGQSSDKIQYRKDKMINKKNMCKMVIINDL